MRSHLRWTAAVFFLVGAYPAAAQDQSASGWVDGFLMVGFDFSARDLGQITVADAVEQIQYTNKLDAGPSVKGGFVLALPGDRASIRLAFNYATRAVTTLPSLCDGFLDCEGGIESGEADATLFGISGGVLFHTASRSQTVRPYLLMAFTLQGYRFDDGICSAAQLTCEATGSFLSDQITPNLSVGMGGFIGQGRVRGMIEVVARLGRFASAGALARGETQNDFQVSAGLSFPLLSR